MALKTVPSFFKNFRPHLPFRFVVQFFGLPNINASILQYAVSSVKLGSIDCDTSTGAFYFGNGYLTVPIYDTSARTIDITFEETDNMDVLSFIDFIIDKQRMGRPFVIGIGITQFDERMNAPVHQRFYSCILADYDEPSFSRSGGVQLVTVNAKFNIMSELAWDGGAAPVALGEQEMTADSGMFAALAGKIDSAKASNALTSFEADFNKARASDTQQYGGSIDKSEKSHDDLEYVNATGKNRQQDAASAKKNGFVNGQSNANPVILTPAQEQQLKQIYDKAQQNLGRDAQGDSFEQWKKRFTQEHDARTANVDQILNNTEKTVDNALTLQTKMREQGYDVKLAGTGDTYGALLGQHSASSEHNNGNKADLQIWKDGKQVDFKNGSNKEVADAQVAIKNTGLVKTGVVEYSENGGKGWMDVNFTGDDWGNRDGVATDGSRFNTSLNRVVRKRENADPTDPPASQVATPQPPKEGYLAEYVDAAD